MSVEGQVVESGRRRRTPSRVIEAGLASSEEIVSANSFKPPRHGELTIAVEDRKDYPIEEAQQGRFHTGEGMETDLLVVNARQAAGSCHRREDPIGCRHPQTCRPLITSGTETNICRTGSAGLPRAHLHIMAM